MALSISTFLEATGIINRPFEVVTQPGTVKFGIGSRTASPESGTYTLTFDGDTTSAIEAAATAGAIETALNGLAAISSAGGVSVTGELGDHFTVRFNDNGAQPSITADVSQLIPDTVAVIDERVAGSASVKEIQEIQLRLTPAVYQDSWSDLSTTVTATIETTVTGSGLANEIQRLSFSQKPFAGTLRSHLPGDGIHGCKHSDERRFYYDRHARLGDQPADRDHWLRYHDHGLHTRADLLR
jgi:hypothetical protein